MKGRITALYRHPVKGFTSERLQGAELEPGRCFPGDRLFAVEDGPSGFDPAAPRHIPKMRFAVLARLPELATARTAYDEQSGELCVRAPGQDPFRAVLTNPVGRAAFAEWLQNFLGERANGALRVLTAPGDHRFMDDERGHVSVLNLASLRALEERVEKALDPLRFRANILVEGWPAWAENQMMNRTLRLGAARAMVIKPIPRCRATHVDPGRGVEDIDLVPQIFNHFGHTLLGVYLRVESAGRVEPGDAVELAE